MENDDGYQIPQGYDSFLDWPLYDQLIAHVRNLEELAKPDGLAGKDGGLHIAMFSAQYWEIRIRKAEKTGKITPEQAAELRQLLQEEWDKLQAMPQS